MSTDLEKLGANWEGLARQDPLGAICSDPSRMGGHWDLEEFFATGHREIDVVMTHVRTMGLILETRGEALDFGCGVGRLTQALCQRFARCWGVDISPTMVENANRFNKHPTTCSYLVNHAPNLPMFRDGQLAFIYTSIVLQHMRPELAEGYLREFARVLAPGAVMVFQMPDHENLPTVARLRRSLRLRTTALRVLSTFGLVQRPYRSEMNCVPEPRLRRLMTELCLRLVDVQLTNSADTDSNGDLKFLDRVPEKGIVSKQYCVVKPAPREGV